MTSSTLSPDRLAKEAYADVWDKWTAYYEAVKITGQDIDTLQRVGFMSEMQMEGALKHTAEYLRQMRLIVEDITENV